MDIVKLGWSGGKDSTCAFSLHLERGDIVKAVCYIPMFTEKIPLLTKRHYEFILETSEKFKKEGGKIYWADGMTYWDYVTHIALSGKYKGQIFGFPCFKTSQCGFKRDSKLKAVSEVDVGFYDYESIGIAIDEPARHNQLGENKRSILVEEKYTESMAKIHCLSKHRLSPHYEYAKRDGCVLCPNGSRLERQIWLSDYPEAETELLNLQDIVKSQRPDRFPLRNYQWFIDTNEVDLFGKYCIN